MKKSLLKDYISVFRPSHWFKNFFLLVGSFSAFFFFNASFNQETIILVIIAFFCTCLAASANYGINEVVDAEFDQYHPTKNQRALPSGRIKKRNVIIISLVLIAVTLTISFLFLPLGSALGILALLIMGFFYNIRPFRTKELPYLDVISESINNPIRLVIGWYAMLVAVFPPASFIMAFWAFGAFLMACKRLAEYRFINDPVKAAQYRKSFSYYNQERLVLSIIAYISVISFSLAIICVKYSISMILAIPIFVVAFVWYMRLTFKKDSPAKEPEKLLKNKEFYIFTVLIIVVLILAKILDPYLSFFLE